MKIEEKLSCYLQIAKGFDETHRAREWKSRRANIKREMFDLFLDIFHGGIDSQNILIFRDIKCRQSAASSFIPFPEQDHLLYMSEPVPWSALEHHHRGFTFIEAVKMGIYSFRLFTLWFLSDKANGPNMFPFQEEGADCDPRAIAELAQELLSAQSSPDSILGAK